jgi:Bacterial Ig domain
MIKMKKVLPLLIIVLVGLKGPLQAQTASFNFSQYPVSISGWNNIHGNPAATVCSATDPTTGFSVSSIAATNWAPYTNGLSAFDSGGITGGTYFPSGVMLNHWYQYNASLADYNAGLPQLKVSGLTFGSVYTLKMTGSFGTAFDLNPTRYTVVGARIYGYIDVNNNNNTSKGAIFNNVSPDSSGHVYVYVNTVPTTQVADICGIQIIAGSGGDAYPTVNITNPLNNAGLPEDGTVTLSATAAESGGSIAKVAFYIDTTKIGESTTAPYNVTWTGADPGTYTIVATAVDANGNSNFASINVNVQSLNFYWSTTGNIGNNGDSNFVGTVDSIRVGFRTKNLERLTISGAGNIGIGTISPTAQFHTTGSVRLAGVTSDSTKTRVLVSDSSGNLFYRSATSLTGRWQYAGGVVYDSTDAIAIGTSNPQGYKLAVNGTAIFTKVRVKTAGTWPDYVFKKGYQLPDLQELEAYLSKYRHLPGIASGADVEKDGIDVGDEQAALLKKVEELTLYLIDENKALKQQNGQLSEQKTRLDKQQQEIDELKKLIREKK